MVAKLKLRDLYPVSLFIALLFTGGLVGASNSSLTVNASEWSKILDHDKTIGSCRDSQWPFMIDPTCKDQRENEVISPVFQREDFRHRLSLVDKITNH